MAQDRQKQKNRALRTAILLVFAAALIAAAAGAMWLLSPKDTDRLLRFQEYLHSIGAGGWFILLGLQYVMIVVAFIPSGPVQIIAGALFGPVGGFLTCLLGCMAATSTIFAIVKKYGHKVLHFFVDEQVTQKYKFLSNAKRLELLALVLFFIPGLPKDALTYLFALTPIAFRRFLLISTLARIPAMFTSAVMGDSIMGEQWHMALFLFLGITAAGVCGALLYKRVIEPRFKRNS